MNQEMQEFAREDSKKKNPQASKHGNVKMPLGLLCKYFPSQYLVRRIIFIYKNIPLSTRLGYDHRSNVRLHIFILQVY